MKVARVALVLPWLLLGGAFPLLAQADGEESPPPLSLEAIEVTPASPGPDTLCQLRIRLKNGGDKIASGLGFAVAVNDQELPVYRNQLFMQAIEPGETAEVRLYNFWTTETGRAMPKDGKLEITVRLTEARWFKIEDQEGTEVWTPIGEVGGLPVSRTHTVAMKAGGGEAEKGRSADQGLR